mmetsp:Transcript_152070/g.276566  ORF Transcript_152070/g.276566 Transcript_152070/m.276566 type:complete len:102 (+) Transcript_152070:2265-2570(+)
MVSNRNVHKIQRTRAAPAIYFTALHDPLAELLFSLPLVRPLRRRCSPCMPGAPWKCQPLLSAGVDNHGMQQRHLAAEVHRNSPPCKDGSHESKLGDRDSEP